MTGDQFRDMALGLDGVTEKAHMNHPDFRTKGRIFASLLSNEERAGLKLPVQEQRVLLRRHPKVFPAAGAWGRQGWTIATLAAADTATIRGALLLAYEHVTAAAGTRRARGARKAGSTRGSRNR